MWKRQAFVLWGVVCSVVLPLVGQSGNNLLQNGSFEQGISPWWIEGASYALDQQVARHGQQSLRLQNALARYDEVSGLVPGASYRISAWFRISASSSGSDWGGIYLRVLAYDWQVVREVVFTPNNRPTDVWFKEALTFSAPADGRVRVHLGFFGGSAWQLLFWLDDARLLPLGANQPPEISQVMLAPGTTGLAPWSLTATVLADDPDGALLSKEVDFGDGARAVGLTDVFQHTYGIAGTYRLTVRVVDDEGASVSWSQLVQVTSPAGAPEIRITSPTSAGVWTTAADAVTLSGTRSGWSGELFWINERTQQSGWHAVDAGSSWSLPPIPLEHGENVLAVQGVTAQGQAVIARLTVYRLDPTYTGPRVVQLHCDAPQVAAWALWECRFQLETRGTDPFLPFGHLPGDSSGITAEAIFVGPQGTLTVPCFYHLGYTPAGDDLRPSGEWHWALRMSFPQEGLWSGKLRVEDRSGRIEVPLPLVLVSGRAGKGYVRPSSSDNRYFEYADGTPFLPLGYNISADRSLPELQEHLQEWSSHGLSYGRFWLSPLSPFSDAWSSWATHHAMSPIGYLPPSLLSYERRYGRGEVSWKIAWPPIANVQVPSIFRGFWSSVPVEAGRTYRLTARVRLEGVTGSGGLVIKTGGWLGTNDVNAGVGVRLSRHVLRGYGDWVYLVGEWAADSDQMPFLYLTLENVSAGAVWIDQFTMQPIEPNGRLGPNILDTWNANAHRYADPIECRKADFLIREAAQRGIYYQVVIFEKNDPLLNLFDARGNVNPNKGSFEPIAGSYLDRLYEAYWRQLVARWGWAPSVAAWELVNEGAPGSYFDLLGRMAQYFRSHGPFPRMVSTSFWSEWVPEYWQASSAGYADVHAYVQTTGFLDGYWIDGQWYDRQALQRDAAALIEAYGHRLSTDPKRNKPVIIGETDLDRPGDQAPDPLLALDTAGVWLHNWVWGHLFAGGVSGLIWDGTNLETHRLYKHYRPFTAFLSGVPLNTARYAPAQTQSDQPAFRVRALLSAAYDDAILWVRHREHAWWRVVQQGTPSPVSGAVSLTGLRPGKYRISEWDPWTFSTAPNAVWEAEVGSDGAISMDIAPLTRDRAWRIQRLSTIGTTAAVKNGRNTLKLWPVPSNDQLFVEAPDLSPSETAEVWLFDARGVLQRRTAWSSNPIYVGDLPPGYYHVQVRVPNRLYGGTCAIAR